MIELIKSFRDLRVYQQSYALTLRIYQTARQFPREELFGLTSQIKRAAYSIPLNIAEGYGKKQSLSEFKRFLSMAIGSCDEMSVILDLVKDLGFINEILYNELQNAYTEIGKMLSKMYKEWI